MIDINCHINSFEAISLDALNDYQYFSDRRDLKYVITIQSFSKVLEKCQENYWSLEINEKRLFNYNTLYFDTPNFTTYHQHHRGKANRLKIRKRNYIDTNQSYFEIKFSNPKGRLQKIRTKGKDIFEVQEFIEGNTPFTVSGLIPVLTINYKRITLLHKFTKEKITFDSFMNCSTSNNASTFNNVVFVEVKTNSQKEIAFFDIMKKLRLKPGSMSKYCLGVSTLIHPIKKSNFKSQLHLIEKKML